MKISRIANNTLEIYTKDGTYLVDYETIVVFIKFPSDEIQLSPKWEISKHTKTACGRFLKLSTKEIKDKLNKGIYTINNNL